MPVLKFRVSWEDDDNIYRDIALQTGQTFYEFHEAILKAFDFKDKKPASFFESNEKWLKKREISSEVLTNKKDAPALAMIKTPVSALVDKPDKKFIYIYNPDKNWTFFVELIAIDKEANSKLSYPLCVKSEGLPPAQTLAHGVANDKMMEIEEKYDLGKDDMDEQGFGNDSDDDNGADNEDAGMADEGNDDY
jgi:hypothetical protein